MTRYLASYIESSEDNFQPRLIVILVGQFIAAAAQPFFLNAPPKYAAIWFSESSRTIGTTIGSICELKNVVYVITLQIRESLNCFTANPFAAAVAMIVIPMLCEHSNDMPFTV